MITNLGDYAAGATVYVPFHTFSSDDPTASVTTSGLAVTDIEIYKDGGTTQRASDNGYTLLDTDGTDFDGITGLHGFSIDLSDNTTAGFFSAGSQYWVAVSSITVDGATINFWAAIFTIARTGGVATILTDTEALLVDTEAVIVDTEAILADTEAAGAVITDTEAILADTEAAITERATLLVDTEAVLVDTESAITERATLLTDTEAILADTNEIQTDLVNGGRLDLIIDAILVDSEAIIADTEASQVAETAILADTEAAITSRATILTDTEAVLADTESAITERSTLLTDTEAILVDTEVADAFVIASGTIGSTGNDTTHLHLTGLTFGDDELNDLLVVVFDNSTSEYHSRWILDWADTGDLATVALLPFTPENAVDTYTVLAVRQDVTGGSGLDAAGVRAAVGLASANLDTQLSTILTDAEAILLDTETATAVITDTEAILADTEAAITERSTLLTDTEALLVDTEAIIVDTEAIIIDTEASQTSETTIITDTEAMIASTALLSASMDALYATQVANNAGVVQASPAPTASGFDVAFNTGGLELNVPTNALNDALLVFTDGTLVHQSKPIASITNLGSNIYRFTFDEAFTTAPTSGDAVSLRIGHIHPVSQIREEIDSNSTQLAAIVTDTEAILTDAEAILVDTEAAAAVLADTEAIIADTEAAITERATLLTDTEATLADTEASQTSESAILTDTEAAITSRATLLTDTEAILADSEASQTAESSILTDTEAVLIDAEAIKVITDALGSTAAARLALSAGQIIPGTVDTGTFAATTTEFEADDITEATADHYIGRIIIFTSGALASQATDITDYALSGSNGHFTVTALTEAPANDSKFIIV